MTPRIIDIQEAVCAYYGLTLEDMRSMRRAYSVAQPRQLAMALCWKMTSRSLPQIGRMFGGRDHTTVRHARVIIADRLERDPALRTAYDIITANVMAKASDEPEGPQPYAELIERMEEYARQEVACMGRCAGILREAAAALKVAQRDVILLNG